MKSQESTEFQSISISNQIITQAGSSEIPSLVRAKIEEKAKFKQRFARSFLLFKLKELGVNSNPYLAQRATKVLLNLTYLTWGLSLCFLSGAIINFYLLEKIEISATSHDARIEQTAQPIRLGDLD